MSELVIEHDAAQMLVVDRGRFGRRHEGIAWCGPADTLAYDVANVLLCNDVDCAAIEVMFGGSRFRFSSPTAFAITGADCNATLDGRRCANWAKHLAREGSVLQLGRPSRGVYSYVSATGGIDVPLVLGSRTTDIAASFGGFFGRALRTGDRLAAAGESHAAGAPFAVAPPQLTLFSEAHRNETTTIRTIAGGEFDLFDERSRAQLWTQRWSIGHQSNRMGYRLHGTPLHYTGDDLPSHGVFPGVVQVPSSGEPIVLLADAHTTGGYPKVGVVIDADLPLVAQRRPGDLVQFTQASDEEASAASQARNQYLTAIQTLALERKDR